MPLITYADKVQLNNNPDIPDNQKCMAKDMNEIKKAINDLIRPVGSYYETSDTSFDPNVTWGGTWELIENTKIVKQKELFNNFNNTNVNVTLNDNLSNYENVLINWKDNDQNVQSLEVNNPNGKRISIMSVAPGSVNIYFKANIYSLSNNQISKIDATQLNITSNSGIGSEKGSYAFITRVIGLNSINVNKWHRTA